MKAGIAACSNGKIKEWAHQVDEMVEILNGFGVETALADHIMAVKDEFSGTDEERARDLMRFYLDESVDVIYDISGGDLSNGVLKHLDFDVIKKSNKTFWGYSDLTAVINAIYKMTGKPSVLYQVENMVFPEGPLQQERFKAYLNGDNAPLFDVKYELLQGKALEGVLIGGNIRCLLKLARTKYWPDMEGKVLFIESFGGESGLTATSLTHLEHLGVFEKVNGVILGTFTNYEKANLEYSVYDLLKMHIDDKLPVAMTREVGHGYDSKAIVIGREITLQK